MSTRLPEAQPSERNAQQCLAPTQCIAAPSRHGPRHRALHLVPGRVDRGLGSRRHCHSKGPQGCPELLQSAALRRVESLSDVVGPQPSGPRSTGSAKAPGGSNYLLLGDVRHGMARGRAEIASSAAQVD